MNTNRKFYHEWFEETEKDSPQTLTEKVLNRSIEEFPLSWRAYWRLELAGIQTVQQLINMTKSELLELKGFGKKSLNEVEEMLADLKINGRALKLRKDLPVNERQEAEDVIHEIACALGFVQTTEPKSEFYAAVLGTVQALKRQQAFSLKREEAVKKAATILSDFANQWKGYAINTQQDWNRFDEISQCLSPVEKNVFELRLGRGQRKAKTLKQIGKIIGLTAERVRQIQKTATKKLQRHISETGNECLKNNS
jgi:RNA polymerase sigma factor (sigma-70 family)